MKPNRVLTCTSLAGLMTVCGGMAIISAPQNVAVAEGEQMPSTIVLQGIVRDFIEKTKPNGHPDFETTPSQGFGVYQKNIAQMLGEDGKPVFLGGGKKVLTDWRTSAATGSKPICHTLYSPAYNDQNATLNSGNSTGGIQSAASFNKWFNDVPGTNLSAPKSITLVKQGAKYVFDDEEDPFYDGLGGFFPIDGELFGNSGGSPNHNFHFTFELKTNFTYLADDDQWFKFSGDDDVWVFIDGKLVIDLGGVHGQKSQYVDLGRLNLTDGQNYSLDFFFAERHRTESNFRMETNIMLATGTQFTVTNAFD